MQLRSLCFTFALLFSFQSFIDAQEWTRFRGPNGTGAGQGKSIPTRFNETDYNWKVELPGSGHSSPVVWGEKIFLLSADPGNATRYVVCLNAADGSKNWVREFKSEIHHLHARSSYASCTPAVDEERVYVGWSTPEKTTFIAFDHKGETVWEKDLGRWQSQHGFGTSPIVYEDLVILHNSQQANQLKKDEKPGKSRMTAFDRKTGDQVWSVPLESKNVCYSVPFIYQPEGGKAELVCTCTGNGMFSLDPLTGEENWSLNKVKDEGNLFKMRTVASPITAGGLIFGSTGSGAYASNYVVAVKPGKKAELVYKLKNGDKVDSGGKFNAPYVPCYIAKDDLLFFIYDKGFVSCAEAKTGKVLYSKRLTNEETKSGAGFNGSPVRVDDRIFIVDEDGMVFVIAADKKFEVLAQNPLGEPCRSTPAVSGGRMYLRTYSHLISIGGKSS